MLLLLFRSSAPSTSSRQLLLKTPSVIVNDRWSDTFEVKMINDIFICDKPKGGNSIYPCSILLTFLKCKPKIRMVVGLSQGIQVGVRIRGGKLHPNMGILARPPLDLVFWKIPVRVIPKIPPNPSDIVQILLTQLSKSKSLPGLRQCSKI